ncbi:MAG: porin, partial [Sphingorhabdus sp.]|nr:porin [Sphingorhabdus sp.]
AVQLNARYDWVDLSDAAIVGGRQQTYGVSLIWTPTEYVRFMANYGHLELSDAAVLAGGDGDYSADVFGMRAQIDF